MKFLTFVTVAIVLISFTSCQTKSIKIIFQTDEIDTATKLNESKNYILKKQTENSDFNYSKLNDIDANIKDTLNLKNLMPIFEPINGKYNYYQFVSTYIGQAYNYDGESLFADFHDILIVKTNDKNKIIDAYQYTLEWSESPFQYDVFKSSAKTLV